MRDGRHPTRPCAPTVSSAGKYTMHVSAGPLAATASAFVATPVAPASLADTLVYQVMVDRFRSSTGALTAPASPGDRAGGTLDGVRAALDAGYFDRLGVTTLWLSPLYTNPSDHLVGRDGHLVAPYHGYWPEDPRAVDPALGGEAALDALVADAHARGLRVLADVVPNHVFRDAPVVPRALARRHRRRRQVSWFNDGPDHCVCGDPGCDWGGHMESCWFAPYLPDLNWRHPDVVAAGTADLVWWMSRFDLDGLRIDAVPMMPRAASRRMVHAVRTMQYRSDADLYVVGETFTGPGDGGRAEIRAYLGSTLDGLGGAFDFPLMWAARDAVAHDASGGFATLEREVAAGAASVERLGRDHRAHDRQPRHHALPLRVGRRRGRRSVDGAAAAADERRAVSPPAAGAGAHAHLPGVPVIYYGDEVGLAGASDPDSRRVLPDVLGGALPAAQQALLDGVAAIGRARRCSPALRGTRTSIVADADHDVALHQIVGERRAVVVLSRDKSAATVDAPGVPAGGYRDALSSADASAPTARTPSSPRSRSRPRSTCRRTAHACRDPFCARDALRCSSLVGCGKGVSDPLPDRSDEPVQPGRPRLGRLRLGLGRRRRRHPRRAADVRPDRCVAARTNSTYGPMTLNGHEKTVTLLGDYRTDSWTNGDAATSTAPSGPSPSPSRGPTAVTYKFHISYDNGAADAYLPDPANPTQVDDGFGGKNSVFAGTTCETLDLRVDADRLRRHAARRLRRSTGATPSSTGPSSIASSTATTPTTRRISDRQAHRHRRQLAGRRLEGAAVEDRRRLLRRRSASTPVDHRARRQRRVGRPRHRRRHLLVHRLPRLLAARSRPRPSRASASSAELTALVGAAHTAGIKVIADYAMNHVHKDSPIYQAHMNDGWFNPLMQAGQSCVCGTGVCQYDGAYAKTLLVRRLPARLELRQRRRARLLRRQRADVDQDLRLRRLPPRRGQAHRDLVAHRSARRAVDAGRSDHQAARLSRRRDLHRRSATSSSRSSSPCTQARRAVRLPAARAARCRTSSCARAR